MKQVVVRKSTIHNAGLGLFALRDFRKGEVVVEYKGRVLNQAQADRLYPGGVIMEYGLQIAKGRYIDAKSKTSCFGRYVNAAVGHRMPNLRFVIPQHARTANRAKMIAIRDIKKGEELFVKYGCGKGLGYERKS